ncbi:MAG: hypothetical protein JW986_05580 [Methanotrichaceae archaeon]|nr:hypothetical protein [Methanotrichaceae archaeon]
MDLSLDAICIKVIYDLVISYIVNGIRDASFSDFNKIFNNTLNNISHKYTISKLDLESFFKSKEIYEYLEQHLDDMDINYESMAKILLEYCIVDIDKNNPTTIIQDIFTTFQVKLLENPELKNALNVKYFTVLKQSTKEIKKNTELILEKQGNLEEFLLQLSCSGKTLKREDFQNNVEFFEEIRKVLNEDPLYFHKIYIMDSKIEYSLIPRSKEAQKLEPIHGSFTIALEQNDGRIIALKDAAENAVKDDKPIVFVGDEIKEVRIYKGRKFILSDGQKIDRIELKPIPFELPVKIFVPNCDIEYDIVLRVAERTLESIIVSNFFSEFPIKFKFQFYFDEEITFKKSGTFNFECKFSNLDVTEAYKFEKFLREAANQAVIGLKNSDNGSIIFIAYTKTNIFTSIPEGGLDLLKKLSFIQEITGKRISLPLQMTAEDINSIEDGYTFLKDRVMRKSFNNIVFTIDKSSLISIMPKIVNIDGVFENISCRQKEYIIILCNNKISLGPIEMKCPPMRLEKSIEELTKELETSNEESINLVMNPINDDSILVIPTEWID